MTQVAPQTRLVTRAARSICILTTVLATGCAVGPDFKAPDAPAISQYVAHDEKLAAAIDGPKLLRWPSGKSARLEFMSSNVSLQKTKRRLVCRSVALISRRGRSERRSEKLSVRP